MRGIVPGNPAGQLAVPLYRLDSCACACRHARLALDDHVWRVLCRRAPALESWPHVFACAGRGPFLSLPRRCVLLLLLVFVFALAISSCMFLFFLSLFFFFFFF